MERIKEYQSLDDMELYCNQVFVSEFDQLVEHNAYDAFLIVPNNVTRLHSFNEYIASYLQTNYADYPLVAVSTLQFV
jgi:hypothetical protein